MHLHRLPCSRPVRIWRARQLTSSKQAPLIRSRLLLHAVQPPSDVHVPPP